MTMKKFHAANKKPNGYPELGLRHFKNIVTSNNARTLITPAVVPKRHSLFGIIF